MKKFRGFYLGLPLWVSLLSFLILILDLYVFKSYTSKSLFTWVGNHSKYFTATLVVWAIGGVVLKIADVIHTKNKHRQDEARPGTSSPHGQAPLAPPVHTTAPVAGQMPLTPTQPGAWRPLPGPIKNNKPKLTKIQKGIICTILIALFITSLAPLVLIVYLAEISGDGVQVLALIMGYVGKFVLAAITLVVLVVVAQKIISKYQEARQKVNQNSPAAPSHSEQTEEEKP
ncbi:hypothetical protein LJC61_07850 [Ruminococcaceae bacterium OttesenSCG-928-A16]|nr:hypothetical protein [Ruminococcaceae bacterium OttesenSCG-928-A16]